MASLNKVQLIGNLGRDPEIRYSADGAAIANISVATTDKYKDKASGEMKETTEWHRVVFFGRLAEIAGEYLKKGRPVYVEGKLRTRKWQNKEGQDQYTTEIVGDAMQMLGGRDGSGGMSNMDDDDGFSTTPPQRASRPASSGNAGSSAAKPSKPAPSSNFDDMDDDLPF